MTRLCASCREPALLRRDHPRFHQNDGCDDLQAVADTVFQFFQEHILLAQERLQLVQQVILFAVERSSFGDIFNAQ
jgi:hypothetical protein